MGAFLEEHGDVLFAEVDGGRRLDEVTEKVPGLRRLISLSDSRRQQAVKTAGHERQLQVAIDFHRHRGGECVHVEEIDAVGDVVLDQHPLGVTSNELRRRSAPLIGQQQRRFLMPQVEDRQLADRPFVTVQGDFAVEDPRRLVLAGAPFQFDPPSGGRRRGGDFRQQLAAPPPQGDEVDVLLVEPAEVGLSG